MPVSHCRNFLWILCLFLIHCSNDLIVYHPELWGDYYVFCEIQPGIDQVAVTIGKTRPEDLSRDIGGALVIIEGADQSVILSEYRPGIYFDKNKELNVKNGECYFFKAGLPDGNRLAAHTYVPGEFEFIKSLMPDTIEYPLINSNNPYQIDYDPVPPRIYFTDSQNALWYSIHLQDHGVDATLGQTKKLPYLRTRYWDFYNDTSRTTMTLKLALTITAYDSNYMCSISAFFPEERQLAQETFERLNFKYDIWEWESNHRENISGGLGYFRSFYSITDTVIVRFRKVEK